MSGYWESNGDVPVMYLPYYHRSLKRHPNFLEYTPGYRSRFGPYLLTSYNWYWNDRLDGVIHLDERVSRGVGGGPDLNLHLPRKMQHPADQSFQSPHTPADFLRQFK